MESTKVKTMTPRENLKRDLLESIVDTETGKGYSNQNEAITAFFGCFNREFNSDNEVRKYPRFAERVSEYVKGLPSCIAVAIDNYTIERELMPQYGYQGEECTADNYYKEVGEALVEAYLDATLPKEPKPKPEKVKKVVYYTMAEAKEAAQNYAQEYGGTIARERTEIEHFARDLEESDSFQAALESWSGSVPAFLVEDEDGTTIGKFGWWTERDDRREIKRR